MLKRNPAKLQLILLFGVMAAGSGFADEAPARTEIASTFDESIEQWKVVELADTFGSGPYRRIVRGPHNPRHIKAPDALSGHLYFVDSPGHSFYFSAPDSFLGDVRDAYGQTLQFDLRAGAPPPGDWYFEPDVILTGADGTVLVTSLLIEPGLRFETYETTLVPGLWRKENILGSEPTPEEFLAVLGGLRSLWIRGEYYSGTDSISLDNVRLGLNAGRPQRAGAYADVINGFVVGATIHDPGFGFASPPSVTFRDPLGRGSGATAVARVEGGWLMAIEVTDAGSNYSAATEIIIAPPPRPPRIEVVRSPASLELRLTVWAEHHYRLESSDNLRDWTTVWERLAGRDQLVEAVLPDFPEAFYRLSEVP